LDTAETNRCTGAALQNAGKS